MAKRDQGKNRHYTPKEMLFGCLKVLRKDIITYVNEEDVVNLLIGHFDRAVSWKPLVFSAEDVPREFRRIFSILDRDPHNRRKLLKYG